MDKVHEGTCAICGKPVTITASFISFNYFTCNMGDEGRKHTGPELAAYYKERGQPKAN